MAATAARDRVLERMELAGAIDAETYVGATMIAVPAMRHVLPAFAPHMTERLMAAAPAEQSHQLTLDRDLQQTLEGLAADAVAGRNDRVQVAIIVADHQTGEMLASVGSAAYRADGRAGFVDLTRALRSPGSTLKPFVYGLDFDQGMIHPETLIEDRPTDFGGYAPQNFDGLYRGELRVRRALQLSLNIPVVSVIEAMGPQHLIAAMQRAGTDPVVPGGKAGLAVALGGIGITLEDLVANYAALANAGVTVDLRSKTAPTSGFAGNMLWGQSLLGRSQTFCLACRDRAVFRVLGSHLKLVHPMATAMHGPWGLTGDMSLASGWAVQMAHLFPAHLVAISLHLLCLQPLRGPSPRLNQSQRHPLRR